MYKQMRTTYGSKAFSKSAVIVTLPAAVLGADQYTGASELRPSVDAVVVATAPTTAVDDE